MESAAAPDASRLHCSLVPRLPALSGSMKVKRDLGMRLAPLCSVTPPLSQGHQSYIEQSV